MLAPATYSSYMHRRALHMLLLPAYIKQPGSYMLRPGYMLPHAPAALYIHAPTAFHIHAPPALHIHALAALHIEQFYMLRQCFI